jgi:hypothetical protein
MQSEITGNKIKVTTKISKAAIDRLAKQFSGMSEEQ